MSNQFFWQHKIESDRKISDFVNDLVKLCKKHRLSLCGVGETGIEIYESGYYKGVDRPALTGFEIDFDSDEGVDGRAEFTYTEEADKLQEEARLSYDG